MSHEFQFTLETVAMFALISMTKHMCSLFNYVLISPLFSLIILTCFDLCIRVIRINEYMFFPKQIKYS